MLTLREPKIKKAAMTLAQQFRQEGHKKGWQEGRVLTLRENVIEVLSERFENVPEELKTAINAVGDELILRALLKSALRAGSLEDFARSL